MKTTEDTKQSAPKPPLAGNSRHTKRPLRNDPTFIALYTAILGSLYQRFKVPDEYLFDQYCAHLAKGAYLAARAAYAQLWEAEPDEEAKSTTETFNAIVGK